MSLWLNEISSSKSICFFYVVLLKNRMTFDQTAQVTAFSDMSMVYSTMKDIYGEEDRYYDLNTLKLLP